MENIFGFLQEVGYSKEQTRIEKYRLDGTSNYLISLNYSGVTWAVAIRLPAFGKDPVLFEKEKTRAVDTAEYLVNHFSQGISLSNNVSLFFCGKSILASYDSVQDFFHYQNSLSPLIEIDEISAKKRTKTVTAQPFPEGIDDVKNIDQEKKVQVKKYLSDYKGAYFVSRGAPASETLDDYFELVYAVTHALAVLHSNTGLSSVFPIDQVIRLATVFDKRLGIIAEEESFESGTPVYESYLKHQKKRNPEDNSRLTALIKKELLLRTAPGKKLLDELICDFGVDLKSKSQYCCFTHNDPHCENFVIVKHLYSVVKNSHQYIDREFINEILNSIPGGHMDMYYSIDYDMGSNALSYRKYREADNDDANVNVITPNLQYDIHIIDIDEATGIDENSKKLYLYDLLIYALSVQNLSALKGGSIHRDDVIRKYYDYRRVDK